jgi:hypothetical protein
VFEGLPVPVGLGILGLGYTLAMAEAWLFYRLLARGDLVTRREADAITARAEKAETAGDKLLDQNTELMDMARLGTATWQALRKAADE